MLRRALIVLLAGFLAGAGAPVGGADPARAGVEPATPLVVTGYALGSANDTLIARNAPGLSTLTVAGVSITARGGSVARPTADLRRLVATAHDEGLRAELLLSNYSNRLGGFDSEAVARMLADERKIARVAEAVAGHASDGGWDGVNVDLESMDADDAPGLVTLLERLREALPETATLTIDVSARGSASAYRDGGYLLDEIAAVVDVVQLMTYDQHGPSWSGPGPIGGLGWQRRTLEAALEQVPAAQLDLGVAGYGYTWPRRGTGHTLLTRGARRVVAADGAQAHWKPGPAEWTATLSDGTRIWWSDRRSYVARQALAREYGLHGLAVWRVGSADTLLPLT